MDKIVRNNKVAILYSGDYGRGWYTYHNIEELLYYPQLVELVEQFEIKQEELPYPLLIQWLKNELVTRFKEDKYAKYFSSAETIENLRIDWIPIDSVFTVEEHDGKETILLQDRLQNYFKWNKVPN
jgi:hypothetical protein